MFYQLQIFLIVALLALGIYELFYLTKLGSIGLNFAKSSPKWLYSLVLTKKLGETPTNINTIKILE
jgi:hypothetical protein